MKGSGRSGLVFGGWVVMSNETLKEVLKGGFRSRQRAV
jgi:hypothetical protein